MPFKTYIPVEKIEEKHDQLLELSTRNWNQRMQYEACTICVYPVSYEDYRDYTPISRFIVATFAMIAIYIASVIASIEDERFLKPIILGGTAIGVFAMATLVYLLLKMAMFITPYICAFSLATIFASGFFFIVGLVAFAIYTYKRS